ncbi:HAMP domain-containing sensor histidine kinase [Flavobacterium sp. JAS]|uniref:sensor histidine kinase n=1 Tax=Flavobacterium sp. JAS TaxID=2897329 RepID=UPI001E5A9A56|nr:HAMP domain-containing sensor histidine kinase [Flavobacterium sp. JAS]MCD0471843.1 HAMP domain-containing histidine kinase [Flavobacterium sp. JAS]
MNKTFSFFKLKFKQRKIIHYSLLVCVIVLQIIAVIIWYNDSVNETEMSKALDSMNSLNKISNFTGKINNSFIESQKNFNTYVSNKDQASLNKYNASLSEISHLIDSLSLITKDNKEFVKILKEKYESESNILALKSEIDSIIEKQINPDKNDASKEFRLNKFEYKKILDSIKTDSYIKVDSVSKKGLFSRLGDALAGKMNVQKEQLHITVTMKYNDKIVSGSIEDQIANVFNTTNKFYENQFKTLKKSFSSLREQDLKLTELNNKLLNLEASIIPNYNKSLNTLQDNTQAQLQDRYNTSKATKKYTIAILIILMFIISIIIFSFTRMAFQYEKRLVVAQNQIRQSLNFKNRIMGMISHEIRSPLSIISIYSKMISSSIKDLEIKETFKSIQFTTNSLLLLSSQILEYSKDENRSPKLENKQFELKSEINQIVSSMGSLVESKGNKIKINSTLLDDIEVNSDAAKIHQLFYNIIGNANKFTKDGLISLSISHEKTGKRQLNLKVEIQDNGIGISKNDLKNIFELYYQGEVSGKVNDLGVGLGLNLCKEIVELFGGQINVESKEGNGTKVAFNLILNQA